MNPIAKATLAVVLITSVRPSSTAAQHRGPDGAAVQAYYATVGGAFAVSVEEVRILGEWRLLPEEIPAVLSVARRAGVSPDVIATLRDAGAPWMSIIRRYGIGADAFRISFPEGTSLGALEETYRTFDETPQSVWGGVPLEDGIFVALVNIRVLSTQLRVPAQRVLHTWEGLGDMVLVHEQLASG